MTKQVIRVPASCLHSDLPSVPSSNGVEQRAGGTAELRRSFGKAAQVTPNTNNRDIVLTPRMKCVAKNSLENTTRRRAYRSIRGAAGTRLP